MEIGVIKDGIKSKVDLIDADQVFLADGVDILPLMTPEAIAHFRGYLRNYMKSPDEGEQR